MGLEGLKKKRTIKMGPVDGTITCACVTFLCVLYIYSINRYYFPIIDVLLLTIE